MLRKRTKLFLILFPVLMGVFAFASYGDAATCGGRSAIGNAPPYWGTAANQNVTSSNGSQVRISIKGEDGCAGQTAQYQIKKGSSIVSTINLNLVKGTAVSGQQDVYILYADWTINLSNGDYKVKLLKVGNTIYSSNDSGNTLTVGTSQACNLDKVYANPNGGKPGEKIKATVEAKGSCQGWGVTININRTTGGTNATVFNGSEQKFPSGSNKLEWDWTLPTLTAGAEQASYKIVAHSGSQNLESQAFLITSGGTGGICGDGVCSSAESSATCPRDCGTGGETGGGEQSFGFEIPNPLKGGADDLGGLVKVLAQWLFNLAIPIAVIMIIYAGVLFLTAQGNPTTITKAKDVLKYAVIGLAIILIGSGFVTLIQSILELGGTTPPPAGGPPGPAPVPVPVPGAGAVGNYCGNKDSNCFTGLKCKNTICQRPTGNLVSEPCVAGASCDIGLSCNKSGSAVQVIDGQTLGTCYDSGNIPGYKLGDSCAKDSECTSGLECNQICQRKGGNLNGEVCVKTADNCKSNACSTTGSNLVGTCVANPTN